MSLRNQLYGYIYAQYWNIGFIEQSLSSIINREPYEIRYLTEVPRDRWFADPFILDYNDNTIVVLVEEYCYRVRRGRIARLSIDRHSYSLLDYKIILDLPTHLSFPFIWRADSKIYIAPENSESGNWILYEYNASNDSIIKIKTLVAKPLTDAIMTNVMGDDLIFSTQIPTQNGNRLSVYNINGALLQELTFPTNNARNAGDWFRLEGKVYRPAQDCNGGYGKAVVLQEVDWKEDNTFVFKDVRRIESTHPKYTIGCHTFNTYKGLIAVDVHGYRRLTLVKTFKALVNH